MEKLVVAYKETSALDNIEAQEVVNFITGDAGQEIMSEKYISIK